MNKACRCFRRAKKALDIHFSSIVVVAKAEFQDRIFLPVTCHVYIARAVILEDSTYLIG